jgi:hypothetical protein
MIVSFIATRLSPETLNRDLTDPEDASRNNRAITAADAVTAHVTAAQHTK